MTFVVLAPLLVPGFVLRYDMAFVPQPRLSADLLGIAPTPPRRVLLGLVVALSSRILPGDVVEKLLLVAVFAGSFAGAARLLAPLGIPARLAAGTLYAWNPFVYERLALGQLAFLLSYATLPWVAAAALDLRRGSRRALPRLVLWLFAAAVTGPYGGAFAMAIAAAVLLVPPWEAGTWRDRLIALGVGVAVNLPWIVPAILSTARESGAGLAARVFEARSDSPLGLAGSLLSLGGLWRTDLAPPGRDTLAWVPAFAVILLIAAIGIRPLRQKLPPGALLGIVALACVGFVAAGGPSFPLSGAVYRAAAEHLPGGGALRDSQKFVAPLALLLAAAFGAGIQRVVDAVPRGQVPWRRAATALVALPVALAPALWWGESGRLFPVHYPPSWDRARQMTANDPASGAILVLPWHLYLPFAWNRGQAVIDPAQVAFTRTAVVSDALEVGLARIPPEDPYAALADAAGRSDRPLLPAARDLGFRYVLLFREADWERFVPRLAGSPVLDEPDLTLYRIERPERPPTLPRPAAGPILAGDVVALLAVGWGAWSVGRRRWHGRPHG